MARPCRSSASGCCGWRSREPPVVMLGVVAELGHRLAGPVGAEIGMPGRPALVGGDVLAAHVALDADVVAVLGSHARSVRICPADSDGNRSAKAATSPPPTSSTRLSTACRGPPSTRVAPSPSSLASARTLSSPTRRSSRSAAVLSLIDMARYARSRQLMSTSSRHPAVPRPPRRSSARTLVRSLGSSCPAAACRAYSSTTSTLTTEASTTGSSGSSPTSPASSRPRACTQPRAVTRSKMARNSSRDELGDGFVPEGLDHPGHDLGEVSRAARVAGPTGHVPTAVPCRRSGTGAQRAAPGTVVVVRRPSAMAAWGRPPGPA